jgi:hypothetical protein
MRPRPMRRHPDAARGDKADWRWAVPRGHIHWRPIRRYRDDRGRDEHRWRHDNRRDDDTNAVAALPPGVGIVRHRRTPTATSPARTAPIPRRFRGSMATSCCRLKHAEEIGWRCNAAVSRLYPRVFAIRQPAAGDRSYRQRPSDRLTAVAIPRAPAW